MEEFTGTPGPWFEHREGFSTVYVEARIDGGMIQEVAVCGPCDKGSEQQSANAKLIAAAPELLEALQLMIDSQVLPVYHQTIARAAIYKALGK